MALDIDLSDPAALDAHPALGPAAELCSAAYARGYHDAMCGRDGCPYGNRLLVRAYGDGWLAGDRAPDRDTDDDRYEEA
jgi:ribosome modulation factor